MVFDFLINLRLSESGLILLIVSVSTITDDVDKDIFVELLAICDCNLHAFIQDVRNISIYMDYWSIDCLCDLCAVER